MYAFLGFDFLDLPSKMIRFYNTIAPYSLMMFDSRPINMLRLCASKLPISAGLWQMVQQAVTSYTTLEAPECWERLLEFHEKVNHAVKMSAHRAVKMSAGLALGTELLGSLRFLSTSQTQPCVANNTAFKERTLSRALLSRYALTIMLDDQLSSVCKFATNISEMCPFWAKTLFN